jgi:TolB-like protein/Flp pilus assembly protein TadD
VARLQVRLLGRFEARLDAGPELALKGRKAQALLAILALTPGVARSRDHLTGLLWSDRAEEQARGSLRQALAALRRALDGIEPSPLDTGREAVILDARAVDCDVADLERLIAEGGPEALARVAELYRGELLEGFGAADPAFDDWLAVERSRLGELALSALGALLDHLIEAGETEWAVALARRLLALDPSREPVHRALMRLYVRQGDRALALKQYQTCREILAREFDVAPEAETEALHEELRGGVSAPAPAAPDEPSRAAALSLPDRPSVAVLPFVNMSGDPEQEYFADGLTEDLIAAMGRFHSVAVIARNSAFHYKGQFPPARQVGEELGVEYLVEGSVRKSGNHIRVSAQLTETTEGKQLWAERYGRELEDVFVVQDEIVSAIVAELGVNLTVAAEARTRSLPPEKLTAYDLLLKGRAAWWRGNVNEGFRLVEEAAAIDPNYAAAQAWLALQYAYQNYSASMDLTPEELGPKSRAIAKRALELDDRDPFVHMAASAAFGFTPGGNTDRGLRHIEIATSMNPHDSEIMLLRAWHLAFHGRFDESLEVIQQVRRLHPFSPLVVCECLADLYYMIGDYEKCLATYEDRSEAPPQVLVVFAACYGQLGVSPEAQRCLEDVANKATAKFDPHRFAKIQIAICARQREADLWRDGFRKVGLDV